MNALKILTVSAIAAASLASASAYAATVGGTATVTIKQPILITQQAAMTLGTVLQINPALVATLTIPASADTSTGTNASSTGVTRGQFQVTGESGSAYTLGTIADATFTNGTVLEDMTMTMTSLPAAGSSTITGGSTNIFVGGTLSMAINQPPGLYNGTYSVVVNY